VQVNVLFPKFYGALAQRLTAHRYFLDSLRVSGQSSGKSVAWRSRHGLCSRPRWCCSPCGGRVSACLRISGSISR
jgi:hypothetical protein